MRSPVRTPSISSCPGRARLEARMTRPAGPATLQIGELAERTGLSHRTLRHYDETGLLRPSGRSDGGFRLYTAEDLERLLLIRRMKPLGFSLEEMMRLLEVSDALDAAGPDDDTASLRADLAAFVADAEERRRRLAEHLAMADEFLDRLRAR